MLDLLQDPQAIRFTDGKKINLKLLKNEIDRRILKITALASSVDLRSSVQIAKYNCSCQVDGGFSSATSNCQNNVLSSLNGNDLAMHAHQAAVSKYGGKSQMSSYLMLGESQIKLISSKDTAFTKEQCREDTSKIQNRGRLDDSNHSDEQNELNLDLSNIRFDENISYEDQANDLKEYIRNTLSSRKKTATDRPKVQLSSYPSKTQRIMKKPHHEPEIKAKESPRILFSQSCLEKIQAELHSTINQKRQYQMDYKARTNLLKKVEQKYKNDIK